MGIHRVCTGMALLLSLTTGGACAADIKAAKCVFVEGAENFFEDNKLTFTIRKANDRMELTFDKLDDPSGNGRVIGNNGTNDVHVLRGVNVINILEVTAVGNINVTTLRTTDMTHGGKVQATHSRHVGTPTALLPSQRVGSCNVYAL